MKGIHAGEFFTISNSWLALEGAFSKGSVLPFDIKASEM